MVRKKNTNKRITYNVPDTMPRTIREEDFEENFKIELDTDLSI